MKSSIAVPTYASYTNMVKRVISPYFREKKTTLQGLTAKDIQDFYLKELDRVSACSVIHYHANIHKALKYAVKMDLIAVNPADKVERPKKEHFVGSFYDADEMNALFAASKGTKLEIPILFGAFYGLRRSEAIGLKWDAIDFEHDTLTIRHTVTSCDIDGKLTLILKDGPGKGIVDRLLDQHRVPPSRQGADGRAYGGNDAGSLNQPFRFDIPIEPA